MLFEAWRAVVRQHRGQMALSDFARGRQWTFKELDAICDEPSSAKDAMVFPQEDGPEFIFAVLRAWKAGTPVCPLEPNQPGPRFGEKLPEGIVHVKTTSASTGEARHILFTARQLAADAQNIVATMGLRPDWPNVGVISLAHSYGFSNLVLPLLLHGIPLVLGGSSLPENVRNATRCAPKVTLPGVPALWRVWHEAGAITENIQLAISAGAPLPLPLEQAIHSTHHLKVDNFYGSSECGGIA